MGFNNIVLIINILLLVLLQENHQSRNVSRIDPADTRCLTQIGRFYFCQFFARLLGETNHILIIQLIRNFDVIQLRKLLDHLLFLLNIVVIFDARLRIGDLLGGGFCFLQKRG